MSDNSYVIANLLEEMGRISARAAHTDLYRQNEMLALTHVLTLVVILVTTHVLILVLILVAGVYQLMKL